MPRYAKYIIPLVLVISFLIFYSLSRIEEVNSEQAVVQARSTAVQDVTDDASGRMRSALSANIGVRALALSASNATVNADTAILVAIEALNVLKRDDPVPHTTEHAVWQTLANAAVIPANSTGRAEQPTTGRLLSPDEQWHIAFNESEKTARLWPLQAGQSNDSVNYLTLDQQAQAITAVAFSPNSEWAAIASQDNTAVLYDLTRVNPDKGATHLTGHLDDINDLAFSPDGNWLATGSNDFTLRLYPMRRSNFAEKVIVLKKEPATDYALAYDGHSDCITAVAFSPDSHWLASASLDGTIRLWSLPDEPRHLPVVLDAPEGRVTHLAFSPQGRWLTAVNANNQSFIWNLNPRELKQFACVEAGRNLTPSEWALHLPELRYRETCELP